MKIYQLVANKQAVKNFVFNVLLQSGFQLNSCFLDISLIDLGLYTRIEHLSVAELAKIMKPLSKRCTCLQFRNFQILFSL